MYWCQLKKAGVIVEIFIIDARSSQEHSDRAGLTRTVTGTEMILAIFLLKAVISFFLIVPTSLSIPHFLLFLQLTDSCNSTRSSSLFPDNLCLSPVVNLSYDFKSLNPATYVSIFHFPNASFLTEILGSTFLFESVHWPQYG